MFILPDIFIIIFYNIKCLRTRNLVCTVTTIRACKIYVTIIEFCFNINLHARLFYRVERVTKPNNLHGLRSRSSSANSGSGCTSPARSPRPHSPSPPGSREHLSTWSASVPALNTERHFENGHCAPERRPGVGKVERTGKENDRPERPEKPERRPNSKELIEKQRNWTSHFSKARPNRYNSDPNRSLVQTSLNSQNAQSQAQQSSSSFVDTCQSSANATASDTASPATRSASFCSARSPPPPPPPVRNSSAASKRERPASIAAASPSELLESPEYATVERFDDISPTIPEYAVVQKKKPQNSPKESKSSTDKTQDASLPEYAVVQKNTSKAALRSAENSKEVFKTQNLKNAASTEVVTGSKIMNSRSTEIAKDVSKSTVQNLTSSATTEPIPGSKIIVSKSVEDTKEVSKTTTQTVRCPPMEVVPVCKDAILRSTENSKETLKNSTSMEEVPTFKAIVSKPMEFSKEEAMEVVEESEEITKGPAVPESKTAIANENSDSSKQTKASSVLHHEDSNPIRSASMDNILTRRESDLLEAPEYFNCPPSPIHSPAKTSEWRNEWLAKNDEILKRTVDLRELKTSSREALEAELRGDVVRPDPRPDWARPSANVKRKETVDDKRTELIRSPESELGLPSAGTDSASSSMSSPSSPSKDSKEEKAEKEMSEKHQTGKLLNSWKKFYEIEEFSS